MSVLEVKNLQKQFGTLEVLRDINFFLDKGEALAIFLKFSVGEYKGCQPDKKRLDKFWA